MQNLINHFFDLIFPPRPGSKALRYLSYDDFLEKTSSFRECEWAITLFNYRDPFTRTIVHELKYHNHPKALRFFAHALYEHLLEEISDEEMFSSNMNYLLVPIPISKQRKKKYKFNPPSAIANEILGLDHENIFEISDILIRKEHTPRQTDIKNKSERLKNAKGVFGLKTNVHLPPNSRVFIVDDVTTTGATLKDARRALKDAGCFNVTLIALAH